MTSLFRAIWCDYSLRGKKGQGEKNVKTCMNCADNLFQRKYYKIICHVKVKIAEKEIMSNQ